MREWPRVQLRHVALLAYGDSLAAEHREEGDVPVYGSNGPVGWHARSNTGAPVLVVGRKGSHGKVQYSGNPVFAIDTTYYIDGSTCRYDLRWLYYVLSTLGLDDLSQDVGVPGLSREAAYRERVPLPTPIEQRAIAHFLDTETARIDALITKKRLMIGLLDERSSGAVEATLRALVAKDGHVPLKRRVVGVTVGIVVTPSEWYADEGILALRGVNIRRGAIDTTDVVHLTAEGHRLHRKSALRKGDVVVVRTGQAGAAAAVPPELDGANCVDLLLVRPGVIDSEFLVFVLNSDWTQKHVESYSVGSIQSHFNVGALRELPVPASELSSQLLTAELLGRSVVRLTAVSNRLHRQLGLLQEHRQALITAAVTGDLKLPRVAA